MHLRPARLEDLPVLEQFSRAFEGPGREPFIARTFEVLSRSPERGEILVIEKPGAGPAGYVILASFWSNEFRGEAVILDELYIAPEHRGGLGSAVLVELEARVRARGVKLIALEVLPKDVRVHALYKRAGFTADRTLYQKKLDA